VTDHIEVLDKLIEKIAVEVEKPKSKTKWTFTQWALLLVLLMIGFAYAWGFLSNIFSTKITRIKISDVRIVGSPDLCPGDLLTIAFYLEASGTGKLVEDATVWVEIPEPKTVIYSSTRPLLVEGLLAQEQTIAWQVPETYVNPSDLEEIPLPPGMYRRIFAISSETDEDVFALDKAQFSIRPDCEASP
jgi:hypothetical protein